MVMYLLIAVVIKKSLGTQKNLKLVIQIKLLILFGIASHPIDNNNYNCTHSNIIILPLVQPLGDVIVIPAHVIQEIVLNL